MICYKDKTFCPFIDCKQRDCDRRLTLAAELSAKKLNLPLSLLAEKPECYRD